MDDSTTLSLLEELAVRLGMKIRYEPLMIDGAAQLGGFCRIKGEAFVIIHQDATLGEKIHILIDAVKRHDLSDIFVMPSLRHILDDQDEI